MKRVLTIISLIVIIFLLSSSLVSASWFSDIWNKITGNVVNNTNKTLRCIDSDGGDNPYVKGVVNVSGLFRKKVTDYCFNHNKKLREYYCKDDKVKEKVYKCDCKDGKCLKKNYLEGKYCTFDFSDYPNKSKEAKIFFDYCEEKIPLIIKSLNSIIGERKVHLKFISEGVPYTGGDEIGFSVNSDPQQPGFLLHEGTHFVQNYGEKTGERGWVMEGIADLVRYKLSTKADEPGWAIGCQGNENYSFGYGCAAAFFLWMESYCNYSDIQIALNNMILDGSDTNKVLTTICKKDLDSLWKEYKATNPPERIYPE